MNKMKLIVSLFVATMLTVAVSAQTATEVNDKFNEAGAAFQAKDFAKAVSLFEQVIKDGSVVGADALETVTQAQRFLPLSLFQQGRLFASQNQFDDAITALTKARDMAELYSNVQVMQNAAQMIGQVYFASGANAYNSENYEEAVKIFSKGFEAAPTNTDMALSLADSYNKLGDLDKATEVYNSVIALESRHSRYAEAAKEAKEKLALAILIKANEAAEATDYDETIRLTTIVLDGDPTNALASMIRLQAANNKKDYKSVIEYGDAAATAQTDDEQKSAAYFLLGAAYQNQQNTAKAIEAFRKVTAGGNVAAAKKLITDLQ